MPGSDPGSGGEPRARSAVPERLRPDGPIDAADLVELLDALDLAMLTLDAQYEILFANRAAERMLGYPPGELQGISIAALSEVAAMQLSGLSRRETPRQILCRLGCRDGSSLQVRIEARPLRRGTQEALLILRDARGERRAQDRPAANSQLATLGQIATGIAHELAQPLTVIRMAADTTLTLVEDGETGPDFLRSQLGLIAGQAHRMAKIVDHMRVFARIERIDPIAFDIRESVRTALSLVERDFRQTGLQTVLDLPDACPKAFGLPLRLEQVLVNLFTNARDAIVQDILPPTEEEQRPRTLPEETVPAGQFPTGQIHVAVTAVPRSEAGPACLEVRVGDTGPGIPENHLGRIFDPFFTTRPAGKGTGLGLTICAALVADMGGSIAARNSDAGAEFVVLMPVAPPAATGARDLAEGLPI